MTHPLAIDLFCGLGGWSEGLLAEQWDCVGFDIERHEYWMPEVDDGDGLKLPGNNGGAGAKVWSERPVARLRDALDGMKGTKPVEKRGWTQGCAVSLGMEGATSKPRTRLVKYPAQLVLQDVLTLHGRQFKDAALIVASPPCQEYSYMAMPWSRAKAIAAEYRSGVRDVKKLTALFDACFRIQREACEAAGHHIPLIVENVRGAIPWVGRSRWNFGSFHLWGDVPALMPMVSRRASMKGQITGRNGCSNFHPENYPIKNNGGSWFNIGSPGQKEVGRNPVHELAGQKTVGHVNKRDGHGHTRHLTNQAEHDGVKQKDADGYERDHPNAFGWKSPRTSSGATTARKAASAAIARIPFPLAQHIARTFKPL